MNGKRYLLDTNTVIQLLVGRHRISQSPVVDSVPSDYYCSQMTIATNVHKSQMAEICIGDNCGNCEQLRFVNNAKL